jgi:hypothetical protein
MAAGATMAKKAQSDSSSVKIRRDLWLKLKLITAVTGEKMSDYINRVIEAPVNRDHKTALKQANQEGGDA